MSKLTTSLERQTEIGLVTSAAGKQIHLVKKELTWEDKVEETQIGYFIFDKDGKLTLVITSKDTLKVQDITDLLEQRDKRDKEAKVNG